MASGCLYLAIFAAVLGMLQFGFVSSVINSPQKNIEKFLVESFRTRYGMSIDDSAPSYFSYAVSILIIGGLVGALLGGQMADKLGRQRSLLWTQCLILPGTIAVAISKSTNSYELLLIGRLFQGIAAGLFTGISPMYVAEIAPLGIRGALGTVNQLAVTSGILFGMVLGLSNVLGSEDLWPVLVALSAIPSILQLLILPFMPESPTYLINTKNDLDGGRKSLMKLHGVEDVDSLMEEISSEKSGNNESSMSIVELLKDRTLLLPLFVCICLHLSQQLSGMVAIFYYSTKFFETAGLPESTSQYSTIGVGAIMVAMTIVTIPLMDRVGRRILHLFGLGAIIIFSVCITIALNYKENEGVGVFLIIATMGFVVSFATGPGSIPWMAAGEIFNQKSRGPAVSVCVFANWLANLVVGLVFPALQREAEAFSFVPFLIICTILFVLLLFYFPETKGLSPDVILKIFATEPMWRSPIGFKSKKPNTLKAVDSQSLGTETSNNYGSMDRSNEC